jgi:hypothetical protein
MTGKARFPFVDHASLTEALRDTLDRLRQFQVELTDLATQGSMTHLGWLEIWDVLDGVKDNPDEVMRPAPRPLIDAYVRVRTVLREIHPMLLRNHEDIYARRELSTLIQKLERDLTFHGS